MDSLKRVDVLHLGSCAVFGCILFHNGHINIGTKRALLHLTVGHTAELKNSTKLFYIFNCLIGTCNIRLRYNFQKRNTATVIVYKRAVCPLIVNKLACVFFHMDFVYSNLLFAAVDAIVDFYPAVSANRKIKL